MQMLKDLKQAAINWWNNDSFTQSAAVAYYTIFSFPALMILYFSVASTFLSNWELQKQTYALFRKYFGPEPTEQFRSIIENSAPEQSSFWASAIAVAILVFASLRLFLQLQKGLNYVWGVAQGEAINSLSHLIKRRLTPFAIMISALLILAISLILTSLVSSLTGWLMTYLPEFFAVMLHFVNFIFSFIVISTLFTLIIKKLPDPRLEWKKTWPGGIMASLLFLLGEYLLGFYFGTIQSGSAYGITGTIILLMIWVSYSVLTLLYGAEYTRVLHEKKNGSGGGT